MTHHTSQNKATLAFDTSGAYCAAALLLDDHLAGTVYEPMKRGQSERLMGLMEELLGEYNLTWSDLTCIGVGVGPGNFTGIRIAVATARGLAASLNVPAVGVSTFEATLLGAPSGTTALVPAPREQVYVQEEGQDVRLEAAALWEAKALFPPEPPELVENIARIAAVAQGDAPPVALYIRPADAAPASDPAPVILDDT